MLYRTIILDVQDSHVSGLLTARSAGCLNALTRTPPSLIQLYTKQLLLDGRLCSGIVLRLLSLCKGVQKVGTYISAIQSCPEQTAILASLPDLREISCPLGQLAEIAQYQSLREGISRLELEWNGWIRCSAWKDPGEVDALVPLQHFQCLTHLCLRPPAYQQEDWLVGSPKLAWLIRACKSLRLLVIAPDYGESKQKLHSKTKVSQASKQHGVGVVVIGQSYWWKNDWEENTVTMWEFAEACLTTS